MDSSMPGLINFDRKLLILDLLRLSFKEFDQRRIKVFFIQEIAFRIHPAIGINNFHTQYIRDRKIECKCRNLWKTFEKQKVQKIQFFAISGHMRFKTERSWSETKKPSLFWSGVSSRPYFAIVKEINFLNLWTNVDNFFAISTRQWDLSVNG